MRVENDADAFVVIAAVRYALKGQRYGVHEVADTVKRVWNDLPYNDRAVIRKEIRDAITRGKYGNQKIDVYAWNDILTLPMAR
jgi:hypothetical protein